MSWFYRGSGGRGFGQFANFDEGGMATGAAEHDTGDSDGFIDDGSFAHGASVFVNESDAAVAFEAWGFG